MANHNRAARNESGFTFIEVLMVVLIIGTLSGIAIQAFASTRATAFDARAQHDLGNAVKAEEANYAALGTYVALSVTGPARLDTPGLVVSETVVLTVKPSEADDSFVVTAESNLGTGKVYQYDSDATRFTS